MRPFVVVVVVVVVLVIEYRHGYEHDNDNEAKRYRNLGVGALASLRHLYETGFAPLLVADADLAGLHQHIRRDLDAAATKAAGILVTVY